MKNYLLLLFFFLVSCSQNNGVYGDGDIEVEEEVDVIDDNKLDSNEELPFTCSDRKLSNISAISAGGKHTCVLFSYGKVRCWGWNDNGQLGGEPKIYDWIVDVEGISSKVLGISAGDRHTCAVLDNGGLQCWGWNKYGQLGDGSNTDRNTPVDVTGLNSEVKEVSTGVWHTCAVDSNGSLECWGDNYFGELGNGTNTNSSAPVEVNGLTESVTAVSTGWAHTCALFSSGGVKCWGWNNSGQLGDGTNTDKNIPVEVSGLSSGVFGISAGDFHTCALLATGGMKCWGKNNYGQLGNGNNENQNVPVEVEGLSSGVSAISAGGNHTCALLNSGGVKCWGWNKYGQLGDGSNVNKNVPVEVVGLSSGVNAISSGGAHTCAVLEGGYAKCWGNNDKFQLGSAELGDFQNMPAEICD